MKGPSLSVVLATPDSFETIRKTVSHLRRQTIGTHIEVVLVAVSGERLALDSEAMGAFHSYQVIEAGTVGAIGAANALGVAHARAPVVALGEDHCFPDPDWAAELLSAHEGEWAAVGPGVRNANPGSAVSWADLLIGYGPWLCPATGGEADFLPGHNSSYKRHILCEYGERLGEMLESETLLHWDLRARGYKLWFQPAATVAHTNFSLWRSWLPIQYYNGRLFAGSRIRHMPAWKRLVYIGGSALIPVVRLTRILRTVGLGRVPGNRVTTIHALLVGLVLDGIGQFAGYLFGPGEAGDRVATFEFRRIDHVKESDRQTVFGDIS